MKLAVLTLLACCALGQISPGPPLPWPNTPKEGNPRFPNGRTQREAIVKEDYKKNLEDAAELAKLADELKADLEKGDRNVVSVKDMKKTDDIERLARNIRGRLKRY